MIKKGSIIFDSQTQKKGVVIRLFPTLDGRKDAIKYRVADGTKEIRTSDVESCREFPYEDLSDMGREAVDLIYTKHLFMAYTPDPSKQTLDVKLVSGKAAESNRVWQVDLDKEKPAEFGNVNLASHHIEGAGKFWAGDKHAPGGGKWVELPANAPAGTYVAFMQDQNGNIFTSTGPGKPLIEVGRIGTVVGTEMISQQLTGYEYAPPDVKDPGAKDKADRFNDGKRKYSLIDFKSLEGMVQVLEYGSLKYSPNDWKKGLPTNEIFESMMRHLVELQAGNELDEETGLHHTGHVLCNAMFLAYMYQSKREFISWNT